MSYDYVMHAASGENFESGKGKEITCVVLMPARRITGSACGLRLRGKEWHGE